MATNNSLIAAYHRFIAAEIKQMLKHKLQIQNSHVWAVLIFFFGGGGQKITFSGSLWQLDYLSVYGGIMALFW